MAQVVLSFCPLAQLTLPESSQNPRFSECFAAQPHPPYSPKSPCSLSPAALVLQSPAVLKTLPMAGVSDSPD